MQTNEKDCMSKELMGLMHPRGEKLDKSVHRWSENNARELVHLKDKKPGGRLIKVSCDEPS